MALKIIQKKAPRIVAVAAGKGGVGKSTLAVLLASALKRAGYSVGLLDADLYGPSIRMMLPEERPPFQSEGKWIPAVAQGIKIFSYAFFSNGSAMRAPIANQVITQFLMNVVWGELDWLLIDFPPGTGDIPLSIAQRVHVNGALLITTPQKIAIHDVKKTIQMFQKVQVPIIGIVENMSYFNAPDCTPFGSGGGLALAEEERVPFLGKIPLDPLLSTSGDCGELALLDPPYMRPLVNLLEQHVSIEKGPIKELSFDGQKRLQIEWENGSISSFEVSTLQKECPCAQCKKGSHIAEDVALKGVEKVGRYGLSFAFSSGCSCGIYPFDLLRRIGHV